MSRALDFSVTVAAEKTAGRSSPTADFYDREFESAKTVGFENKLFKKQ
ncbi:MAG: hypothetical protein ACC707_03865 [Thiohalomonadales bacterium]